MIDLYFYILTLQRTQARTLYAKTMLLSQGISEDHILMHYGRDGMDYETNTQINDAMYDSIGVRMPENVRDSSAEIGCYWSSLECLKSFIESKHTLCYFSQDDRILTPIYDRVQKKTDAKFDGNINYLSYYRTPHVYPDLIFQIERLLEIDPKFKGFLLWHREGGYREGRFPFSDIDFQNVEYIENFLPIAPQILGTGDSGLILTKEGAIEIIETMKEILNFPEDTMYVFAQDKTDGWYSSTTPNRWLRKIEERWEVGIKNANF